MNRDKALEAWGNGILASLLLLFGQTFPDLPGLVHRAKCAACMHFIHQSGQYSRLIRDCRLELTTAVVHISGTDE
jgi:hypothetical protein